MKNILVKILEIHKDDSYHYMRDKIEEKNLLLISIDPSKLYLNNENKAEYEKIKKLLSKNIIKDDYFYSCNIEGYFFYAVRLKVITEQEYPEYFI